MPSSHLHMCVPIAEGNITNSQNFYPKQRSQTNNEEIKEKEKKKKRGSTAAAFCLPALQL